MSYVPVEIARVEVRRLIDQHGTLIDAATHWALVSRRNVSTAYDVMLNIMHGYHSQRFVQERTLESLRAAVRGEVA